MPDPTGHADAITILGSPRHFNARIRPAPGLGQAASRTWSNSFQAFGARFLAAQCKGSDIRRLAGGAPKGGVQRPLDIILFYPTRMPLLARRGAGLQSLVRLNLPKGSTIPQSPVNHDAVYAHKDGFPLLNFFRPFFINPFTTINQAGNKSGLPLARFSSGIRFPANKRPASANNLTPGGPRLWQKPKTQTYKKAADPEGTRAFSK